MLPYSPSNEEGRDGGRAQVNGYVRQPAGNSVSPAFAPPSR